MKRLREQASPTRARLMVALPVLVAPLFFSTALFRLGLSDYAVVGSCLLVAALLLGLPRVGLWAAAAWLTGCVLDALFLLWLFHQYSGFD
ncbi:MAG TPA: hypothetical protein VNA30_03090 [Mycobacteriales bacterium]|nr:hypothetical protein [Mycobacteriales bacterium]